MSKKLIVGMMRVFDFPYLQLTVDHFGECVDKLVFIVDRNAKDSIHEIVLAHPKTEIVVRDKDKHSQPNSLTLGFKTIDDLGLNPYAVFFPDEDELFPPFVDDILGCLAQDEHAGVMFNMLHHYGSINYILDYKKWISKPHCKAVRYWPGIRFRDDNNKYVGLCRPFGIKEVYCDRPVRHLNVIDKSCSDDRPLTSFRKQRARCLPLEPDPRVLPFVDEWRMGAWRKVIESGKGAPYSERPK